MRSCLDFQNNVPVPNITTNDVHYKRQLGVYQFNIHIIANGEIVAGKGSNEVLSMLNHFVENYLDPQIKHLQVFCDLCESQNKNCNTTKYMHYIIHIKKRQKSFPIRGHSYLELQPSQYIGIHQTDTKKVR